MPKFVRFVLTIVIATVLGPVFGGLPFFVISAWQMALSGEDPLVISLWLGPMLLFAYIFGGVIAFIAGTIVAVVALRRQPSLVIVLVAAVVANVVWEVAVLAPVHSVQLAIDLALSVFGATICWLLFRRLLANP